TGGIAVDGFANAATGTAVGVRGVANSTSGTGGEFDNLAGGDLLKGFSNSALKFRVDGNGNVLAAGYRYLNGVPLPTPTTYTAGDGLALSGSTFTTDPTVARKGIDNNFAVGQTSPTLNLPATTDATNGVFNLGGSSFLHRFGNQLNVFLGK